MDDFKKDFEETKIDFYLRLIEMEEDFKEIKRVVSALKSSHHGVNVSHDLLFFSVSVIIHLTMLFF
jgi:hypothetical protein